MLVDEKIGFDESNKRKKEKKKEKWKDKNHLYIKKGKNVKEKS